jgi:hypothetical protein
VTTGPRAHYEGDSPWITSPGRCALAPLPCGRRR